MSCAAAFDWRALVAHRLDARLDEPAGWPKALAHFGACAECRRAALTADPTLVFLRLGEEREGLREPARDQAEIERVRAAVAAMRAASRLERARRPARLAGWKRWAGAAGLAMAALTSGQRAELPAGLPAAEVPGVAAKEPGTARMLILEDLNLPEARVHLGVGDRIAGAMIYSEGLDV